MWIWWSLGIAVVLTPFALKGELRRTEDEKTYFSYVMWRLVTIIFVFVGLWLTVFLGGLFLSWIPEILFGRRSCPGVIIRGVCEPY
jgi:hypothetical protein